jgi:hypothetical protein
MNQKQRSFVVMMVFRLNSNTQSVKNVHVYKKMKTLTMLYLQVISILRNQSSEKLIVLRFSFLVRGRKCKSTHSERIHTRKPRQYSPVILRIDPKLLSKTKSILI